MAVTFTNEETTNWAGGGANSGATGVACARPTAADTDDLVWLIRHEADLTMEAVTSGTVDGDITGTQTLYAVLLATTREYRRITSSSDQAAGWTFNADSRYTWATIRLVGANTTGTAFTGGTAAGSGSNAGEGAFTGASADRSVSIPAADAGDLGVCVVSNNEAITGVSSGWSYQQLAWNGRTDSAERRIYIIWKEYASSSAGETLTFDFAASTNNETITLHGVVEQAVVPDATVTPASAQVTLASATASVVTVEDGNATATPASSAVTLAAATATVATGTDQTVTPAAAAVTLVAVGAVSAAEVNATVTPAAAVVTLAAAAAALNTMTLRRFTTTRPRTDHGTQRPDATFTVSRP